MPTSSAPPIEVGAARALLIDFDGTLAHSLGAMWEAYGRFAAELGFAASRAEFDALNGPPLSEIVETLVRTHRPDLPMERARSLYEAFVDEAALAAPPSHGAANLLAAARAKGRRVAIVSSNARSRIGAWLDAAGLAPLVDVVVGGDTVPGKPAPAPYLAALAALGCAADAARAIEDSPSGYASARAAGIETAFYAPLDRPPAPAGAWTIESLPALARALDGEASPVRPRLAVEADRPFLHGLRNDPVAVRFSRTPRQLSEAELLERFALDPSLEKRVIIVLEASDGPAAMVRFDLADAGDLISIAVAAMHRGRGLGAASLRTAMDAFLAMRPGRALVAEILPENAASRAIFEATGFAPVGQDGNLLVYRRPAGPTERR